VPTPDQEATEPDGRSGPGFEARIARDGTVFDARDASLLRAVDANGSLNAAVEALGRSFAHAQRRIVAMDESFGQLLERHRGGAGGGGSELTPMARDLLARFNRLRAEFSGVTAAPYTELAGNVVDRSGELATVETGIGRVRALTPAGAERVQLSVRGDAITLTTRSETPDENRISALNRFSGTVASIETGETVATVELDIDGVALLRALVTRPSVDRLGLEPGVAAVASFKATTTRAIPRRSTE